MNLITIENITDKVELHNSKDILKIPVIYFIIKANKIIYIGQTCNLHTRCIGHSKNFLDKDLIVKYIICNSKKERNELEKVYIEYYNPEYNIWKGNLSQTINFRIADSLFQKLIQKSKEIDRHYGWIVREALKKYLKG